MNDNSLYHEYLSHLDSIQKTSDTKSLFRRYRHLYSLHLPKDKNANILEIGCGKGNFLKFLLEEKYNNILGIDIGNDQIDYCKMHVTDKVLLISDLEYFLNSQSNTYDTIVMLDVLEHIQKQKLMAIGMDLRAALKSGGKLIIKTPNASNPVVAQMIYYSDLTHETMFTETSLRQWCNVTGFQSIEFFPDEPPVASFKNILRKFARSFLHKMYQLEYYIDYTSISHKIFTPSLIAVAS